MKPINEIENLFIGIYDVSVAEWSKALHSRCSG